MTTESLADRLAEVMEDRGVTDAEVARRVSEILGRPPDRLVPKQTIQKIRSGETKKPQLLVEIAKALDVDPVWLSTGKGDKRHHEGADPALSREARELVADWAKLPPAIKMHFRALIKAFLAPASERYLKFEANLESGVAERKKTPKKTR